MICPHYAGGGLRRRWPPTFSRAAASPFNRARGERPGTAAALPIMHALHRSGALGDDTVAPGDITMRVGNRDESACQPTPDCDESIGLAVASDLPVSWTATARQTGAGEFTAGPAASGGAGRTAGNS